MPAIFEDNSGTGQDNKLRTCILIDTDRAQLKRDRRFGDSGDGKGEGSVGQEGKGKVAKPSFEIVFH